MKKQIRPADISTAFDRKERFDRLRAQWDAVWALNPGVSITPTMVRVSAIPRSLNVDLPMSHALFRIITTQLTRDMRAVLGQLSDLGVDTEGMFPAEPK